MRLPLPLSNPPTLMLGNYSPAWSERYASARYLNVDPTVAHALVSTEALLWSDQVFVNRHLFTLSGFANLVLAGRRFTVSETRIAPWVRKSVRCVLKLGHSLQRRQSVNIALTFQYKPQSSDKAALQLEKDPLINNYPDRLRRLTIAGALLLLHGAGWMLVNRPQSARNDAAIPQRRGVLELRFFSTRVTAPAAVVNRETARGNARENTRPAPRLRRRVASPPGTRVAARPSPLPASAATMSATAAAPALDIDALRQLARANERGNGHGNEAAGNGRAQEPAFSGSGLAAQAIARAARPKCDNDYAPAIGAVTFTGLMKLPALIHGAVRDSGCKW